MKVQRGNLRSRCATDLVFRIAVSSFYYSVQAAACERLSFYFSIRYVLNFKLKAVVDFYTFGLIPENQNS